MATLRLRLIRPPVTDQAPQRSPSVAASDRGRTFLRVGFRLSQGWRGPRRSGMRYRDGPTSCRAVFGRSQYASCPSKTPPDGTVLMQIRNLGGSGLRVSAVG